MPYSDRNEQVNSKQYDTVEEIADIATTTAHGCSCVSLCGTNYGTYDWCKTKDKCGHYEYFGFYYWDKCQYLSISDPSYNDLKWNEKQNRIWRRILTNDTIGPIKSEYATAIEFLSESWQTTYENEWDVMPAGRVKTIHPIGAVCPIVLDIRHSPFTGILKSGQHHGIIRMGPSKKFDKDSGIIPGCAIKVFRSGKRSANIITFKDGDFFETIEGSQNFNFFSFSLSNHISGCTESVKKALHLKFGKDVGCPTKLGLSDACTYDHDGFKEDEIVFPFKVS